MITAKQLRAARSFLNLDQQVVAEAVGVSKANISDIENEKVTPKASTLDGIQKFFEANGIEFRHDGIVPADKVVQILEGNSAYLQLLDDVARHAKGLLLKSGVDESKSSAAVIEKNRTLRAGGIRMRNLVEPGNTHIMGALEEYRHMPEALFSGGDVKLIYGGRVAYLMAWADIPKVIIIHDRTIATEQERLFDYVWNQSLPATMTTAPERYE
jgi:transcriptional regulator with XRE-family HTH domain